MDATVTPFPASGLYAYRDSLGFERGPFPSYRHADIARGAGDGPVFRCDTDCKPIDAAPAISAPAADKPAPNPAPVAEPYNPSLDALRSNQNAAAPAHVKARQEAQHRYLYEKHGIAYGPTAVAAGTRVVALGDRNFAVSRRKWEKAGRTVDNLAGIEGAVKAEARVDVRGVRLRDLRMDPATGGIYRVKNGPSMQIAVEAIGLRSLFGHTELSKIMAGASDHYLEMPPCMRAGHFNECVDLFSAEYDDAANPATCLLRTRLGKADEEGSKMVRAGYAFLGDGYKVCDTNVVAKAAREALSGMEWAVEQDPHGTAVYNPVTATLRAEALFHADHVVDLSAGDTFKGGLIIRADDKGGGSVRGDICVWRNDCVNLIIISKGKGNLFRLVHRGDLTPEVVAAAMAKAAEQVNAFIAEFAQDWGLLRRTPIASIDIYGERFTSVPDAIRALAKAGRISDGLARDATVEAIIGAWKVEAGQTAADLINAVTRFARSAEGEKVPVLVNAAKSEQIEEDVGNVLLPDFVKFARRAAL